MYFFAIFFACRNLNLQKYLSKNGIVEYVPHSSSPQMLKAWVKSVGDIGINPDVVFFGNSIIRNANFNKAFTELSVLNFGVGGEMSVEMMSRVSAIKDMNPRKVFLMTGINDTRCYDKKTIEKHFAQLTDSLSFIPELYVISILPLNHIAFDEYASNKDIEELNAAFSSIFTNKNIPFIDVYDKYCINGELPTEYTTDGIHIREEAYLPLYDAISKYIYPYSKR